METVRVYKFYSQKWALEALKESRLKISQLNDLNDPFEFLPFNIQDQRYRNSLRNWRKNFFDDKGIICFSSRWSNPVLWSHYADSHKGAALGFDIDASLLKTVDYTSKRLAISDYIHNFEVFDEDIVWKLLLTKFTHWRYETEKRLFVGLDETEEKSGLYFKQFDDQLKLREIVLGAHYVPIGDEILNKRLQEERIKIVTSRLAFGSFKIVSQRKKQFSKKP